MPIGLHSNTLVGSMRVATDPWTAGNPMPTPRYFAAAAVAGGENVSRSLDLLESYDPVANVWFTQTPSLTVFTRATAGVVSGKMRVFGNTLSLAYDPVNEIR